MSARIFAPLLVMVAATAAWPADSIHQAASRGDLAAVEALLVDGADPDSRDEDGRTPLQMAAYSGHLEVARLLLAAGADPNAADRQRDTALAAAVFRRRPECVRILLEAGADPAATDGGMPALLAVAASDPGDPAIVRLLVEHGATHTVYTAAGSGDLNALRALLAAGADPNAVDADHGKAPLHWAAQSGHAQAVALLLAAGAEVDRRSQEDATPLHHAVFRRHVGAARALLDGGADPNAQMGRGWVMVGSHQYFYYRPLQIAAYGGQPEMVRLLLDRGADPDGHAVYPPPGASGGPAGPAGIMIADQTPLQQAVGMANSHYGRQFLRDGWSWTELIAMLLAAGADVNARDGQGRAPLHHAGYDEALLLLDHGADVNALDAHGNTPLHVAAARGDLEMVGLCNAGAPLSLANADGLTPLAVAEGAGHAAVAEALRGWGATGLAAPAPPWTPRTIYDYTALRQAYDDRSLPAEERLRLLLVALDSATTQTVTAAMGLGGGPIDEGHILAVLAAAMGQRLTVAALEQARSTEPDTTRREVLTIALGFAGSRGVIPELSRIALHHPRGALRDAAIGALGDLEDQSLALLFRQALSDPHAAIEVPDVGGGAIRKVYLVRRAAAQALRRLDQEAPAAVTHLDLSPTCGVPLVAALLEDRDPGDCEAAVRVLLLLNDGAEATLRDFVQANADDPSLTRAVSMARLAALPTADVVARLGPAMAADDRVLAQTIASHLRARGLGARAPLEEALANAPGPTADVLQWVLDGLANR